MLLNNCADKDGMFPIIETDYQPSIPSGLPVLKIDTQGRIIDLRTIWMQNAGVDWIIPLPVYKLLSMPKTQKRQEFSIQNIHAFVVTEHSLSLDTVCPSNSSYTGTDTNHINPWIMWRCQTILGKITKVSAYSVSPRTFHVLFNSERLILIEFY